MPTSVVGLLEATRDDLPSRYAAASSWRARPVGRASRRRATTRRRNRTFQAGGCPALPVLKTGWATRPVPRRLDRKAVVSTEGASSPCAPLSRRITRRGAVTLRLEPLL